MLKVKTIFISLFLTFFSTLLVAQTENSDPYVNILNEDLELSVGDSVQLQAEYVDSTSSIVDTTLNWEVTPSSLGTINENLVFHAADSGRGFIKASFGLLSDSVEVHIRNKEEHADSSKPRLKIFPEEVEDVVVGDTINFSVVYMDSNKTKIDTTAAWSLFPDSLGLIDSTGIFIASKEGHVTVYAELGTLKDSVNFEIEKKYDEDDDGDDNHYAHLKIVPEEAGLNVGDSLQFHAFYIDSSDTQSDTTVVWSLMPDSIAVVDSTGLLVALRPGKANLTATLDSLSAQAEIEVYKNDDDNGDDDDNGGSFNNEKYLVVMPKDTVVTIGSSIQFFAYFHSESSDSLTPVDSNITWELKGMPIGSLSDSGLLNVDSAGFAFVYAKIDEHTYGSSFVIAKDSTADSTGINTITITKSSRNPRGYSVMRHVKEGQVWTIGGLPHPMNIFNGGKVYFPIGSLKEDIRIHIEIPKFVHSADSTDEEDEGVISGVQFKVFVGDSLVEPYYFETPLIVGLVFKRGLLEKLDIDPYTLSLYFVDEGNGSISFDSTGIGYTTVDFQRNRIFSSVAHFSTLALKGKTGSLVTGNSPQTESVPKSYSLEQNYPNPFNPSTRITYSIPEQGHVKLIVYNILGQQVKTLVNTVQDPGIKTITWNGTNEYGQKVSSGIYLYQIKTDRFIQTKKMMLLK